MSTVDELVAFLRGCLDEDERVARAGGEAMDADNPSWPDYATYDGPDIDAAVAYLKQFRPARVLREVEAKRRHIGQYEAAIDLRDRVIAEYKRTSRRADSTSVVAYSAKVEALRFVLLDDAIAYVDRPGFQETWPE
jgi:hypothetical protein